MEILKIITLLIHICMSVIINKSIIDDIKFIFFPYLSTVFLLNINHLLILYTIMYFLPESVLSLLLVVFFHAIVLTIILKTDIKIFYFRWTDMLEKEYLQVSIFKKFVAYNFILSVNIIWLITIFFYAHFHNVEMILMLCIALSSICFYILLMLYFRMSMKYAMVFAEMVMDKPYRKEMESYLKVIRSQRHDFNFHLHAISGMLNSGKITECSQYVQTMVRTSNHLNEIVRVNDPAIAAMLNIFRENASIIGIEIDFDIRYNMENIGCTSYEFNKIIGNLLQNAIDETEIHKNFSYGVKVLIFKRSGNTVIDVSNIFYGDYSIFEKVFKQGYSTKDNHEGIGLSAVSHIIERREGVIYTEFEKNIIHFIVSIPNRYIKTKN